MQITRLTSAQKAQAEKIPVYLETHAEKNFSFYQKCGFQLVRTEVVPGYDLRFWCFMKEPGHS